MEQRPHNSRLAGVSLSLSKNVKLRMPETATDEGLANQLHISGNFTFFKGAAMRASTAAGPLRDFYENLLAKGRKPTMARLTLARKIAAITLIVWKKEVRLCAGINRHEVENARVLRERTSDSPGLEFCAAHREVHSEA